MKFTLIILLSLFFLKAEAETLRCESDDNLTDARNVERAVTQKPDCEKVNKDYSCAQRRVDPDLRRKQLTEAFDKTSDKQIVENSKRYTKWCDSPYFYCSQYDKQQNTPTHILDWFTDKDFADLGLEKTSVRNSLIDKIINFEEKFGCVATFKASSSYIHEHPTVKPVKVENKSREMLDYELEQYRTELNKPENIKAVNDSIDEINKKALSEFHICTKNPSEIYESYRSAVLYPPCAGNFKKHFKDNEYDISKTDLAGLMNTKEAKEISACIKERLSKGAKISQVSIFSSASTLDNTGKAAAQFCAKGFLDLSKARAETAKNKVVPMLFANAGFENAISTDDVQTFPEGLNKDGTSGDCAYEIKDGKEVLKTIYDPSNKNNQRSELDKNKYVKVQVTFESSSEKIVKREYFKSVSYSCKRVEISCSHVPKSK